MHTRTLVEAGIGIGPVVRRISPGNLYIATYVDFMTSHFTSDHRLLIDPMSYV